jgi:hypothetical protein
MAMVLMLLARSEVRLLEFPEMPLSSLSRFSTARVLDLMMLLFLVLNGWSKTLRLARRLPLPVRAVPHFLRSENTISNSNI